MKKLKLKQNNGFTLLETLIYVVIFTFFVIAAVSFGSHMTATRLHNQMMLEINDQGSRAMRMITQTIRNSNQVNSPTISSTASNLSLVTNIPTSNPTVFSLNNGALYILEGSGSPTALTNNKVVVSNLIFSNFSRPGTSNIIKVSFTITSLVTASALGGTYSFTFNGSAALRK